ncbi:glucosamine-6-phosphate deaminase [Melghiribacillus thermohalophilus]|uniref:glucosamine-6-phosphate deaminase n=1 Tax=Melghiribacillus thermohalophilus TaxID=1324956 RepID=UPI0010498A58|nr:glucosamine-6-phosphate deaminase [Melghiribacillus thermohalophilus]
MRLIRSKDYDHLSQIAAKKIIEQVKHNPHAVLGLATGSTPLGTYRLLIEDHQKNETSYYHVQTVNLDEYVGLPSDHPASFHAFMKKNLFNLIDLKEENIHLPNGNAKDLDHECEKYEKLIEDLGGIDLQLLGIGRNGHIGFNEPGTPFSSKTHVVQLSPSTRRANACFFQSPSEVPENAITMGINTIMQSREILLLASGVEKAPVMRQLMEKSISIDLPASVLHRHSNVTVIADEEALSSCGEKLRNTNFII